MRGESADGATPRAIRFPALSDTRPRRTGTASPESVRDGEGEEPVAARRWSMRLRDVATAGNRALLENELIDQLSVETILEVRVVGVVPAIV